MFYLYTMDDIFIKTQNGFGGMYIAFLRRLPIFTYTEYVLLT